MLARILQRVSKSRNFNGIYFRRNNFDTYAVLRVAGQSRRTFGRVNVGFNRDIYFNGDIQFASDGRLRFDGRIDLSRLTVCTFDTVEIFKR